MRKGRGGTRRRRQAFVQENAGQEATPPPAPTAKPQPGRRAPSAGRPDRSLQARELPETPASRCPKTWCVGAEERKRREPEAGSRSAGIPGAASGFKRPDRPPEPGNPDRPARMRIGCTLSSGIVTQAATAGGGDALCIS